MKHTVRRSLLAITAALSVLIVAGAAYGAALTQTLAPGDSLVVKCGGPQLNWSRQSTTQMTLKCRTPSPTPTPSTSPSSSPSPTPSTSPTPSPTPTPTPSSTPTGNACVTSAPSGNCGPYSYAGITDSNGYNTYVGNNCWGDPNCQQTVTAYNPGNWSVVSTEPAGNGSVRTYPNVAQLTTTPASGYQADYALANLSSLTSTYAETTPYGGGMIAQFAYDVWISNAVGASDEIMLWTDNSGRDPEDAGAKFCQQTTIAGQVWTLNTYNGGVCGKADGEVIFSLGARHAAAQQPSGTVDIKAMLDYLVSIGWESSNLTIGQIDAGWEVCSTGGAARTFSVSNYTLTMGAK